VKLILLSVLLAISLIPLFADEGHHHEELTVGQLGTVHFATSCAAPAQEPFTRGVAQLHSFWYEEAEKSFQQAAQADAQCAIAYWGEAMSLWHQLWNHPDEAVVRHGLAESKKAKSLRAKTARERDYIAAVKAFYSGSRKRNYAARSVAYSNAIKRVYKKYPEDHEAAAFYALSLLALDPGRAKEAAPILEKLFAEEPDHPGVAHYLIHSYDTPERAELGLPAARRYAKIAPAAPHALHMPSHIFARLGLWQDDIDSNLASIAASRHSAEMHMGGESHEFHAMDFLVYAYLQSGHETEARQVIEQIRAMPPMKDMYGEGFDPHITDLIAFEASCALEMHRWAEASLLPLIQGATPGDNAITHWARALGAGRAHKAAEARMEAKEIETIRQQLLKEKHPQFMLDAVERDHQEALVWADYAEGHGEEAITRLRALADKERGVSQASDQIPAREMLADMLLEVNRPELALVEYQADLKMNPNRFDGLYGAALAADMSGKHEQARAYYAQLAKQCEGSDSQRPELAQAKTALHGE
jgi:tetratricopeptide (TPR) repeat protein